MFVCPSCEKLFFEEEDLVKHFLSCWKKKYPVCKSKEAPHSKGIETRVVNEDISNFFDSLRR